MRRNGSTIVEVIVALAVVSIALMPVLSLVSRGFDATRMDRVRVEVEALCHNLLERFGRGQDGLELRLEPVPGDPGLARAPARTHGELLRLAGHSRALALAWRYDLAMRLELRSDVRPGLDLLTCEISWLDDRTGRGRRDSVTYKRFLIHEHVH